MNTMAIMITACAALSMRPPAATNEPQLARIHLVTGGRQHVCRVLGRDARSVTIARTLDGGGTATENYLTQQIAALVFPRPASLAALETQRVAGVALDHMLSNVTVELAAQLDYADIRGSWAAPLAFERARLLERAGRHRAALALYTNLPGVAFHPDLPRAARLRTAVCAFLLGRQSNALARLEGALAEARSDAERAEAHYYIGCARACLGDHTGALFSLLRNVVFYAAEKPWEAESLAAALPAYAALGQRDAFEAACRALLCRFPDSPHAYTATNALHAAQAGSNLTSLVSFPHSPLEASQ